jgi:hypothetical protein
MENSLEVLPVQTMGMLTTEQLKEAWTRSEQLTFGDPTLSGTPLPLQRIFFPLGFPLSISTNSEQVMELAEKAWSGFESLFAVEPINIHIGVTDGGSPVCPPAPVCRMREHLCSNIADAETFLISDFNQGFSFGWVNQATLAHASYFRYFFLESAAMGQIANRHAWGIHAACVELDGEGVLLCGDSGAGKSTLSYGCARAGWTFITDDGSYLVDGRDDRLVVGNCHQARFRPESERFFAELTGGAVTQRMEESKPSIEFATTASQRLITSQSSRVRHIVFLNRNTPDHELLPFPTEVARLYLLQWASSVPEIRRRQETMFDHLLGAGVYELRYTDLSWAIARLSQLAREGC